MKKIITISREYAAGGRKIAKLVAEQLNIPYYDKDIVKETAKASGFEPELIESEGEVVSRTDSILKTICSASSLQFNDTQEVIHDVQQAIILRLVREGPCVIVGRCADYILRESNPTRIFVYADMESKIRRCFERAPENEHLTEKEMRQYIQKVDKNRAVYYEFYTGRAWGDWHNYDLCINTSGKDIKVLVDSLTLLQR